jgi:starvation-inducible DNA-binding protein
MSELSDSNTTYLGLSDDARAKSIAALQPILANAIFMQQLYKKYHWHVEGEDFYELHLLFDKHADEQLPLIDAIGERIRTLGGRAAGLPADVLKNATLTEPSDAEHNGHQMIKNLLKVHHDDILVLRQAVKTTAENNDDGTNDLLVSEVLRTHELQTWFIRSSASRHEA